MCPCANLYRSCRAYAISLRRYLSFHVEHRFHWHCSAPLPYVVGGIYTPFLLTPLSNFSTATTLDQVLPNSILSGYRSRNCQ